MQLKADFDFLLVLFIPEYPDLDNGDKTKVWFASSGRSIDQQSQKGMEACRKLKGYLRVVDNLNLTGKPDEEIKLKCATRMYKKLIKGSPLHDTARNPTYFIDKDIPYPERLKLFLQRTKKLGPVKLNKQTKYFLKKIKAIIPEVQKLIL